MAEQRIEQLLRGRSISCSHSQTASMQQGLNQKAETFYNRLIDKNPYSAPYWFGLARCYFEQQLFDKAIEACDYAIVADEEFAESLYRKDMLSISWEMRKSCIGKLHFSREVQSHQSRFPQDVHGTE